MLLGMGWAPPSGEVHMNLSRSAQVRAQVRARSHLGNWLLPPAAAALVRPDAAVAQPPDQPASQS
eukprot:COSAG01_NODE_2283_length_7997_cov_7.069005_7_plen_65_part_00